jgi:putative PIN family toxin of toxin-antitoxin system
VRIVLDTSAWVRAALDPNAAARRPVRAALAGDARLVTSEFIRWEVTEVLRRPRLRRFWPPGATDPVIWFLSTELAAADVADDATGPRITRDPKDDPFLWAAYAGRADLLLSYDPDLLEVKSYRGTSIMKPERWRLVR